MATFNGSSFIQEQLTSLNSQRGVEVKLLVNDDGSTDTTLKILQDFKNYGLDLKVLESDRMGPDNAFFRLLEGDLDSDFIAFCDQDDVWDPEKLIKLISELSFHSPQLSFCSRRYINDSGEIIGQDKKLKSNPSFRNALVENVAPGNCVVLNRHAIQLVKDLAEFRYGHYDAWIYLVVSAFGECFYVSENLVDYRIHANNSIGLRRFTDIFKLKLRIMSFINMAVSFNQIPSQRLSPEHRKILLALLECVGTRNLLIRAIRVIKLDIRRQRFADQILFKIGILIFGYSILVNG